MGFLIGLSRNLTRFTALVILLASAVAFIGPASFAWVKGDVQVLVLGIIMLGMGMTLGREDYRILAQRPLDVFIGAAAQYTVMPLLAIGIAKLFDLSPGLTLGLVLVGTCPGGVSSNIMSFLAKGDVAFSVGMTTVSTVLAPAVTPLWMTCLVGQTVDMDGWGMFRFMLLVTLLPVVLGSAANILLHGKHWFENVRAVMPGVAVLAFACIVGGVASVHGHRFAESALVMVLAIAVHNIAGYVSGYYAAALFGMDTAKKTHLGNRSRRAECRFGNRIEREIFPRQPRIGSCGGGRLRVAFGFGDGIGQLVRSVGQASGRLVGRVRTVPRYIVD